MIIVGLLGVALICLVVGLALPSTAWLIASLIASVGAGYVLFRARTLIAGAHAVDAGAKTAVLDREPAPVGDAEPPRRTRAQARAEARAEARAAKAAAAAEADADAPFLPDEDADAAGAQDGLHVSDTTLDSSAHGGADGHTEKSAEAGAEVPGAEVSGAELLSGVNGADAGGGAHDARVEHEFDDAPAAAAGHSPLAPKPEPVEANEGDVWVIDGRPRYHLASCAIIQGQDAEPIPFEQATEDGFMPCSLCEPNVLRTPA